MKGKGSQSSQEGVLTKRKIWCHFCNKTSHFMKDCDKYAWYRASSKSVQVQKKTKMGAFKVTITPEDETK